MIILDFEIIKYKNENYNVGTRLDQVDFLKVCWYAKRETNGNYRKAMRYYIEPFLIKKYKNEYNKVALRLIKLIYDKRKHYKSHEISFFFIL